MQVKWSWMVATVMVGLSACSQSQTGGSNAGPNVVFAPSTNNMPSASAPARIHTGKASIAHADIAKGKQVFASTCSACHGTGLAGAPRVGDKAAWAPHLAKGDAVLLKHAENGFTGHTGTMPPRGGNPGLSNQDVADAIAYMKSRVQ